MRALLLSDIRLLLPHLLVDKGDVLQATAAGQLYGPRLAVHWEAIVALPEPGGERRPLVDAIAQAHARHHAFGSAIWHYVQTVLRAPDASAPERAAAERICEAFVPQLSVLQLSHATLAAQAHQNRARIPAHAEDLARFPVPGESSTLAAWVEGLVSAGESLGELIIARAEQRAATGTRGRAAGQRSEVLGLLSRLRAALADELADDPATLRERDAELFGFIDELAARREQSLRRRAATAAAEQTVAAEKTAAAELPAHAELTTAAKLTTATELTTATDDAPPVGDSGTTVDGGPTEATVAGGTPPPPPPAQRVSRVEPFPPSAGSTRSRSPHWPPPGRG